MSEDVALFIVVAFGLALVAAVWWGNRVIASLTRRLPETWVQVYYSSAQPGPDGEPTDGKPWLPTMWPYDRETSRDNGRIVQYWKKL